jgi:hypothetical protein
MMYNEEIERAYKKGFLINGYHDQLLKNVNHYLEVANIPPDIFFDSIQEYCTEDQIVFIREYPSRETIPQLRGLILSGDPSICLRQMQSMATGYIRNYIDARVVFLKDVIDSSNVSDRSCSVLLIPDFFMDSDLKGIIASWQIPDLLNLLYMRATRCKPTILYSSSLKSLSIKYGKAFTDHFKNYFIYT